MSQKISESNERRRIIKILNVFSVILVNTVQTTYTLILGV